MTILERVSFATRLEEPFYEKEVVMELRLRWKLKALPILNPAVFPLRFAIATFITFSEPSAAGAEALEAALGKLSNEELDEFSHPGKIPSTSEAVAFCANKGAQSSEYDWKQQDNCLVLLSKSKFAESRDMPGVIFEFIIRTSRNSWTVYRVPDPGEILDRAVYFERNELITHSQRPLKSPIRTGREKLRFRLAKMPGAVALALSPLPGHRKPERQHRKPEGAIISEALSA